MFLKSAVRGSLEKPRVGEIGISITLRLFRFFFNSEVNYKWFISLVNNKKHISFFSFFFLQLEQPFCTELLVYSFVETKITRIKEEGVFLVSRSRWIE